MTRRITQVSAVLFGRNVTRQMCYIDSITSHCVVLNCARKREEHDPVNHRSPVMAQWTKRLK